MFVDTLNGIGVDYKFLGVISGFYPEDEEITVQFEAFAKGRTQENSGIAMIVPADPVKDLIENNQTLKSDRQKAIEDFKRIHLSPEQAPK